MRRVLHGSLGGHRLVWIHGDWMKTRQSHWINRAVSTVNRTVETILVN